MLRSIRNRREITAFGVDQNREAAECGMLNSEPVKYTRGEVGESVCCVYPCFRETAERGMELLVSDRRLDVYPIAVDCKMIPATNGAMDSLARRFGKIIWVRNEWHP